MAIRFYFVPAEIIQPLNQQPRRGPKYFKWRYGTGVLIASDWIDYGTEEVFLVGADLSIAEHDALVLNADVTPMPEDLSTTVSGGEINDLKTSFEAFKVPGNWITAGTSYTVILKRLAGMFFVLQCIQGEMPQDVKWVPANLNASLNTLSQISKDALTVCEVRYSFDTSGYTGTSPVRNVLAELADQWPPITIAGVTF